MIREFTQEYLEGVIQIILKINIGKTSVRYYPTNRNEIINRIKKRIMQPDVILLIRIEDDQIISYGELLVDESERYLQLLAHFAIVDYKKDLHNYFNYFQEKYKGYGIHYVLSDFNTDAIKFMKSTGASNDGFEKMMHISKNDFSYIPSNNIYSLDSKHNDEFCKLHNKLFEGAYWTGELLLNNGKFHILVSIEDNNINGYAVISDSGRSEEEIYFIYAENLNRKRDLYYEILNHGFNVSDSIQVLITKDEESDTEDLTSMGFKLKESIITFWLPDLS
jgi:hypothetical protein